VWGYDVLDVKRLVGAHFGHVPLRCFLSNAETRCDRSAATTASALLPSVGWRCRLESDQAGRGTFKGNSPSEREPCRIALFNRRHRLSGHPSKGADLSFQGERLLSRLPTAKANDQPTGTAQADERTRADPRSTRLLTDWWSSLAWGTLRGHLPFLR
jgi:hypothetical protein